jgi:hypothetical protein
MRRRRKETPCLMWRTNVEYGTRKRGIRTGRGGIFPGMYWSKRKSGNIIGCMGGTAAGTKAILDQDTAAGTERPKCQYSIAEGTLKTLLNHQTG